MTISELSVEGTASVKDELDAKAVRKAREAFHSHTGGTLEVAIRAYLAAAPSRDQVSMGALRDYWLHYDHQTGRWLVENEPPSVIRTGAEVIHTREVAASLVPTAEQGDAEMGKIDAAIKSAGLMLDPVADGGGAWHYVLRPIAGAREELVERLEHRADIENHGAAISSDGPVSDLLEEAAASISQLYSRIGELTAREEQYVTACYRADDQESRANELQRRAEAAEARIGELERERDEANDRAYHAETYVKDVDKLYKAAEAKLAEARRRYENWQPIAITPESLHLREAALLHFYTPGTDDETDPDTWLTTTWDERPDKAVAWCSISTPNGPEQAFFDAVEARSFHSPKEPDGGGA